MPGFWYTQDHTGVNYQPFEDKVHIIYVNGAFKDTNHPIGRLVHDLWCTRADDMLHDVLAQEVSYMKETEEWRTSMCEIIEKLLEKHSAASLAEGRAEGEVIMLYKLVNDGDISLGKAAAKTSKSEVDFKQEMVAYFLGLNLPRRVSFRAASL